MYTQLILLDLNLSPKSISILPKTISISILDCFILLNFIEWEKLH